MASKKSSPKSSKEERIPYTNIKFVFNNLDKSMLDEFDNSKHSSTNLDDIDDSLIKLVEYGYRLSIREDTYTGAIQVTATCDLVGKPSAGYATSARSNSFIDAIRILVYKILVVADNDLSQFDNQFRDVRG